jgi:hypothetical protein
LVAMSAKKPGDPALWERYELSIGELVAALDPLAEVRHDERVPGRLSDTPRQIDVWAHGRVAGVEVIVAVECKRHGRPMAVGHVDQFIGKILDIGADRGVLYSHSGFTNSAVMRAMNARNPNVVPVALKTPNIVLRNQGVPGYPARLLVQEAPPLWIEDLDRDNFAYFLETGDWSEIAL